jgi:HD-like signal output (HDOD) protein
MQQNLIPPGSTGQTIQRIQEGLRSSETASIAQVIELIRTVTSQSDSISIEALSEVIGRDLTIMFKLIRMANTLAFNPEGTPVTTISQAIHVVGFDRIRNLAVSLLLLENAEGRQCSDESREAAGIALVSGLVAHTLARQRGLGDPEQAFVCASLRSYGQLLLTTFLPESYRQASNLAANAPKEQAFRTVFGITPDELGQHMLAEALLPEEILEGLKPVAPAMLAARSLAPEDQLRMVAEFGLKLCELINDTQLTAVSLEQAVGELTRRYARIVPPDPKDLLQMIREVNQKLASFGTPHGAKAFASPFIGRFHQLASPPRPPSPESVSTTWLGPPIERSLMNVSTMPQPAISRPPFARMHVQSRRQFLHQNLVAAGGLCLSGPVIFGQERGERPASLTNIKVINPCGRVPVGLIIDDSTCLVNLNRFAVPQFAQAWGKGYTQPWRDWPVEIPDRFVRKFGEWSASHGVKGKYSIVPYPACVGRLDRLLPGWTQRELKDSLDLVRSLMMPNWDIHPEMVTHTRVIDTRTGHPYPEFSLKYMENWDWTTDRSVDELSNYLTYALNILKEVGLTCEGITTPGGFGSRARPQLAQATLQSVRDVFQTEIPHYFRDLYDEGQDSVAPRVEYASDLQGTDPRCVVSIVGCTGDWTGGWDCSKPEGPDRFITADLQRGRLVDVIQRGEPALMVCHWTGIYWNGEERGLRIFQEVVRRLHERFDHLVWMKLSEVARYWAARELTAINGRDNGIGFHAPFACPTFTVQFNAPSITHLAFHKDTGSAPLKRVSSLRSLVENSWHRQDNTITACFSLPRHQSWLEWSS